MKRVIITVLSLGLLGALIGCTASSGRVITGIVADVDGNPIPGAIVTTDPPTSSIATDKSGRYMIKAVPEKEYTLKATKMGYVSYPTKITVRGLDFVQGDIQLTPEDMVPAAPAAVYVEPQSAAGTVVTAPAAVEAGAAETNKTAPEPAKAEEKSSKAWWEK